MRKRGVCVCSSRGVERPDLALPLPWRLLVVRVIFRNLAPVGARAVFVLVEGDFQGAARIVTANMEGLVVGTEGALAPSMARTRNCALS